MPLQSDKASSPCHRKRQMIMNPLRTVPFSDSIVIVDHTPSVRGHPCASYIERSSLKPKTAHCQHILYEPRKPSTSSKPVFKLEASARQHRFRGFCDLLEETLGSRFQDPFLEVHNVSWQLAIPYSGIYVILIHVIKGLSKNIC